MKIEVRPVPRKDDWKNLSKDISFTQPTTIMPSSKGGRYQVAISDERLKELGLRLGLPDLDLYIKRDINGNNISPWVDPKYAFNRIKLYHETNILNDDDPIQEIQIGILKGSDFVCNSLSEYESGDFIDAKFIIYDEAAELESKAKKYRSKNELITKAAKLDIDDKTSILQFVYDKESFKRKSPDYIDVKFNQALEDKTDLVRLAMSLSKEDRFLRGIINEALYSNILIKDKFSITYNGEVVGTSVEDLVIYFKNPQNQIVKADILAKLNK